MSTEIERKFLVIGDAWRHNATGKAYCQGYLSRDVNATVRVRVEGNKACITVKGPIHGISRSEFEYSIPVADAIAMQELCKTPLISKTRYRIPYENHVWEVDEFHDENEGLVVAEVELDHENEQIEIPPWIGLEVSNDRRYCNSNLSINPYKSWL
ncbi:MAG: CYTH domain-containing protein [Chthoniobacterales bacterium]